MRRLQGMPDPAPSGTRLTIEEYLARESRGRGRHEFVAGDVYALSGGSLRHNTIALNIASRLRAAVGDGPCRVFINDVKVRAADDLFYYPDVVVACGPMDDTAIYLRDPCLIVEVTSPSTESIDRREKLVAYRQVAALQAYVVVSQRRRSVEVHRRDATGAWTRERITDGLVSVPCPRDATLALDEIYAGVTLPTVAEPEPVGYDA